MELTNGAVKISGDELFIDGQLSCTIMGFTDDVPIDRFDTLANEVTSMMRFL